MEKEWPTSTDAINHMGIAKPIDETYLYPYL